MSTWVWAKLWVFERECDALSWHDPGMQLIWNASIREKWDLFESEYPRLLEQSWAYGEAMENQGLGVERAQIMHEGECIGLAQFITRRVLGYIGLASCSRGPVWSRLAQTPIRAQALRLLRQQVPLRPLKVVLFSPSATDPAYSPKDTGRMTQVITGDSTVLVNLRQSDAQLRASLHGKWRNRLKHAEQQNNICLLVGSDPTRLQWLLQQEARQRREKRFHGLPLEFVMSFASSHPDAAKRYTVCEARVHEEVLASMLFLHHGLTATYHIGWLDEKARSMNLHNLLLWQGMLQLRQQGLIWLDLGGVNTEDLGGISHFKLSVGGEIVSHPGTFF